MATEPPIPGSSDALFQFESKDRIEARSVSPSQFKGLNPTKQGAEGDAAGRDERLGELETCASINPSASEKKTSAKTSPAKRRPLEDHSAEDTDAFSHGTRADAISAAIPDMPAAGSSPTMAAIPVVSASREGGTGSSAVDPTGEESEDNKARRLLEERRRRYREIDHLHDGTNVPNTQHRETLVAPRLSAKRVGEGRIAQTDHGLDKQDEPAPPAYAVILQPGGQVSHDVLLKQLAAFFEKDITTTRRAVRHGKGILARDLEHAEATLLEAALRTEGQPVLIIEQLADLSYDNPKEVDALKCEGGDVLALTPVSKVPLNPRSFRMLGTGVVRPAGENGPDVECQLALDIFGSLPGEHWRMIEPVRLRHLSPDSMRGSDFIRLLRGLREAAPTALYTPVFELMCEGRLDTRHCYPDLSNFDNYHQWLLWAHFSGH